jgi:Mg/Co/Ni transporter MgtE
VISWKDVAYVEAKDPLRLKTSQEKISKLPPADIASILNDLDRPTGQSLLQRMGDDILADTLEESPSRFQIDALSRMGSERAADILEEMDPDEAADLIASLPQEKGSVLLDLMEKDDAEDIRNLLDYPPDSAGGIMTTEFAWIPQGLTVEKAMASCALPKMRRMWRTCITSMFWMKKKSWLAKCICAIWSWLLPPRRWIP